MAFGLVLILNGCAQRTSEGSIYQLKMYHVDSAEKEEALGRFLEMAYLPALRRAGIADVGVFKPIADNFSGLIYVLIPYSDISQFLNLEKALTKDKAYAESGKYYLEAGHRDPPYVRIESILMTAFTGMSKAAIPRLDGQRTEHVYELRSYESPTERHYKQKVKMFNEGDEISIFDRLGFNAVFYGEVISGGRMPNLMYMTSFRDMEDRNQRWARFDDDPAWKALKSQQEYKNSVSHSDIILLQQLSYSGF